VNTKLVELARRRESLVSRSAVQREQLAQAYRQMQKPATLINALGGVFRTLKEHPALLTSLTAVFVGARRRGLGKLALALGIAFWALRPLRAWWSKRRS